MRVLMSGLIVLALAGILVLGNTPTTSAQGGPTPTPLAASCGRTLANITALLGRTQRFSPQARPGSPTFCADLEVELNVFMEARIKALGGVVEGLEAQSTGAFAFLDLAARQYVGTIPRGTFFSAVARNALPGSRMILVAGEGFRVYVDYRFTSLSASDFERLPDFRDYTGSLDTECAARWCQPPGPRPPG